MNSKPTISRKKKAEFSISTKAELITEKVNTWIEEHPDADIWNIVPFMSYTTIKDKGATMIGCMIEYDIVIYEFDKEDKHEQVS